MRESRSPDARGARPDTGLVRRLRVVLLLAALACTPSVIPRAGAADPAAFEGLPLMRTFTPLDYHGHTECCSAAQDTRGIMYIGNFAVVLEYDGVSWRKIPAGNIGWINQMAYEPSTDRVYIAGQHEIGYLQRAPGGERTFVSLIDKLPADARAQNEYRGLHVTASGVFFVSEHQVVRWHDDRPRIWALPTTKQLHSGWAGGHLYVQTREIGLLRLDGDTFVPATDNPLFRQTVVRSVVDGAGGEVIVATHHDGIFTLHDGAVQPWNNAFEGFFKDKGIYQFLPLRDGSTAIATDTAGLLVLDRQGHFRSHVDNAGGVHGNNLLNLFEDAEGGLWICLQSGITRAEIDSPFSLLSAGPAEDLSNVVCGDRWFGTMVLGTLSGLYRVVPADPATATGAHLERLPGITDTFTSAAAVENGLMLAGDGKIVLLDRDAHLVPVFDTQGSESHLYVSRLHPGRVYVGSSDGKVRALQFDAAAGRWTDAGLAVDTGHIGIIYGMTETSQDDLWLGTDGQGLLRARASVDGRMRQVSSLLDAPGPLHGERAVWVAADGGAVFFQTPHGIYQPDERGENVRPCIGFDLRLTDGSCRLEYIAGADPSAIWVVASSTNASSDGLYGRALAVVEGRPPVFQSLPEKVQGALGPIQGFSSVERPPEKPANLLITGPIGHGVIRLDVGRWETRFTPPPFGTLIRRATTVGQEGAAKGHSAILQDALPASRNSVHFEYSANTFALGADPAFQTRLVGLESSEWSDFGDRNSVDYYNLPAGSYTFEVRARLADGLMGGVAAFPFRVLPPWQRTWWAYALDGLLAAVGVYALVRWRLWRLRASHARLEEIVEDRTGELLHARDAADSANRAKSAFLANMTHELRTPLNAILGYSQILIRDPELSARNRERIATVDRSGNHLLSMINEVLDLSKIEAGKLTLLPTSVMLDPLLNDLCAAFRPRFAEKNLAFENTRDPGLPTIIHTDAGKLRQVLFNLLGNALKFTREGRVLLEVTPAGTESVRFAVIDTGVGIAAGELRDIFLAFHQAGGGETAAQGTGLGLSISQRLVELLGGRLQVESEPGKGSRFWFDLSLPPMAAVGDAPNAGLVPAPRGQIVGYLGAVRRLLIVDDEPVNRSVLAELLAPLGFETEEVDSGEDCLQRCAARPPDAILLDLRMGGMGGLEVARTLRGQGGAGAAVRIVAVSASVFVDDRQQAIDAGCDDFLPKPFKEEQLLEMLGRLLTLDWVSAEPPENDSAAPTASATADPGRFTQETDRWMGLARNGDILGLQARFAALRDAGGIPERHLPMARRLETLLVGYEIDRVHDLLVELKRQENNGNADPPGG